jgi:hypothetical protein
MMGYGKMETWKVVYMPKVMNNGARGVALVEADCHQMAMQVFRQLYEGEFATIESCKKLLG